LGLTVAAAVVVVKTGGYNSVPRLTPALLAAAVVNGYVN